MIYYTTGNLLESDADCLVNTVNCVGVMGKGIALQFKQNFPDNFLYYRKICNNSKLDVGKIFVHKEKGTTIINFPTKIHWQNPSELEYIKLGLETLRKYLYNNQIKSVAIPKLGCNNGGLNWKEVKPLIEKELKHLQNIDIYIYE